MPVARRVGFASGSDAAPAASASAARQRLPRGAERRRVNLSGRRAALPLVLTRSRTTRAGRGLCFVRPRVGPGALIHARIHDHRRFRPAVKGLGYVSGTRCRTPRRRRGEAVHRAEGRRFTRARPLSALSVMWGVSRVRPPTTGRPRIRPTLHRRRHLARRTSSSSSPSDSIRPITPWRAAWSGSAPKSTVS